ncbi:hypothetical protein, partial [Streptomyces sp. NTH33]|uniref:hypothetical protein n=1 Tax=Streptomyces sp. NTH33 TaxID=1735453 RepID=UPI001C64F76C
HAGGRDLLHRRALRRHDACGKVLDDHVGDTDQLEEFGRTATTSTSAATAATRITEATSAAGRRRADHGRWVRCPPSRSPAVGFGGGMGCSGGPGSLGSSGSFVSGTAARCADGVGL